MRRTSVLAILLLLASFLLVPASPAGAGPSCGIRWGSLAKSAPESHDGDVTGIRTGRHACFDRLVVDISGDVGAYEVRYVDEYVPDGATAALPVRGGARLHLTFHNRPFAHHVVPTFQPADANEVTDVRRYSTFRQVVYGYGFQTEGMQGIASVGLGVRARLPFRVFTLDGPGTGSRLVVDVAHRW